ncbi:MAG: hypothetical protein IPH31_19075 [Lewinellaceae bacterium]|nr:hypothetical protein [Lewinellaceae bacterium]
MSVSRGNKLIFASTQPGGFGGWDIYVSNWTSTGWSEPLTLVHRSTLPAMR